MHDGTTFLAIIAAVKSLVALLISLYLLLRHRERDSKLQPFLDAIEEIDFRPVFRELFKQQPPEDKGKPPEASGS